MSICESERGCCVIGCVFGCVIGWDVCGWVGVCVRMSICDNERVMLFVSFVCVGCVM